MSTFRETFKNFLSSNEENIDKMIEEEMRKY